jgi:hypothetical protein
MPAVGCSSRSERLAPDGAPPEGAPPSQRELAAGESAVGPVNWYGLILEGGPGTVTPVQIATADDSISTLDADPLTPGPNGIAVGAEPVGIVVDVAGCHAITANAGSCDLSLLDVGSAVDRTPGATVERLAVRSASGAPVLARPAAIVAEPSTAEDVGFACPARPTGIVYVAYPSCHAVAAVRADTGTVVGGIRYSAAGVPAVFTGELTCPRECGASEPSTPGTRPVALDLELDARTGTRRLVIGSDNSATIDVVELDLGFLPLSISRIALESPRGDLGIVAVALSPQIGMGGDSGTVVEDMSSGGELQFVYAVATDGTVRVADVSSLQRECDTQIDPRFARAVTDVRRLSCFPVGDPTNPPRRPGRGPGMRLPDGAVPLSVDIVRGLPTPSDMRGRADPARLIGHFAAVSASDGSTYIVTIDDDDLVDTYSLQRPAVPASNVMAHQLRDSTPGRTPTAEESDPECTNAAPVISGGQGGTARTSTPVRSVPDGTITDPDKRLVLPSIRQVKCEYRVDAPTADDPDRTLPAFRPVSELAFGAIAERTTTLPDPSDLPDETWTLAWEGAYSAHEATVRVDGAGTRVVDASRRFCEAGVERFDFVQFRGCDPAASGACPSGYVCYVHPESTIQSFGSCMRSGEAERLRDACRDFLTSFRRYTVKTAKSGELLLSPRRHELRATPVDGCTSDSQCESLASYAVGFGLIPRPGAGASPAWTCEADPDRAPIGGTGKRCLARCTTTTDCVSGTVCQGASGASRGYCMEGVAVSQSCVNGPQRLELRASEAFAVLGSASGFAHPIVEGPGGVCQRDPLAAPRIAGRIPLEPRDPVSGAVRRCDPAANPVTGALPGGGYEPNPCATTAIHEQPKITRGGGSSPCEINASTTETVTLTLPAVKLRNLGMNLTLVDPYYAGDATCPLDRGGSLGKIPHLVPGYTLTFRVQAPSRPQRVRYGTRTPSIPVRVLRGPRDSIWVVDEGDYLSTSSTAASTRGNLFRAALTDLTGGAVFN